MYFKTSIQRILYDKKPNKNYVFRRILLFKTFTDMSRRLAVIPQPNLCGLKFFVLHNNCNIALSASVLLASYRIVFTPNTCKVHGQYLLVLIWFQSFTLAWWLALFRSNERQETNEKEDGQVDIYIRTPHDISRCQPCMDDLNHVLQETLVLRAFIVIKDSRFFSSVGTDVHFLNCS